MALIGGLIAAGASAALQTISAVQQAQTGVAVSRFNQRTQQRQAEQQALLLERDARVAEQEAQQEAEASAFDIRQRRRLFGRQRATRRAAIGAAGTEFTGSNLLVAADEAREMELDIAAMQFASEGRQAALRDEAGLLEFQAGEARRTGQVAAGAGRFERRQIRRELPLTLAAVGVSAGARTFDLFRERSLTTRMLSTRRRIR